MLTFCLEHYFFVIDSSLVQINDFLLYSLLVRQNGTKLLLRTSLLLSIYGYIRISQSDLFDMNVSIFMISFCHFFFFYCFIRWRTMFGIAILPSILLALGMAVSPESPRWLFQVFLHDWSHLLLKFLYIQSNMFSFNC